MNSGATEVERRLQRAGVATGKLDKSLAQTGSRGKASSLLLAGGALAAGVALERVTHHAAEYAGSVRRIQQFTGGTAEESSKLAFVLGRLGIDAGTGTRSLGLLSKNLENGNKNMTKYFTSAQLARLRTGSLIQAIPILAQKYQQLNTAQARNAFLLNVFGRGGTQIRRLLELDAHAFTNITLEAQKFGLVLTQDNLTAFRKFTEEERRVGQSLKGLEVQVATAVLPAFEQAAHVIVGVVSVFDSLPAPVKTATTDLLLAATGVALVVKGAQFLAGGLTTVLNLIPGVSIGMTAVAASEGEVALGLAAMNPGWGITIAGLEGVATTAPEAAGGLGVLGTAMAALPIVALVAGLAAIFIGIVNMNKKNNEFGKGVAGTVGSIDTRLEKVRSRIKAVNDQLGAINFQDLAKDPRAGGGFDVMSKRAADLNGQLRGLKHEEKDLESQQRHLNSSAQFASTGQQDFALSLQAGIEQAMSAAAATRNLNALVDKFGLTSPQAAIGIQAYVDAVTNSTAADEGANDATTELGKSRAAATAQGIQLAQQEADAAKKRQEDEQTAADNVIHATQGVQDAKQRLADTQDDAARSIRDADRAIADAEDNLREAQNRAKESQQALTDARKEAGRALEDLQFRVEEGGLSEERNRQRVKEARAALADARKGGDKDKVVAAELDLKEALLQQREQVVQGKRDQEELNKRRKEGVKGSPEVVAAEKNLKDATKGVTDAQRGAADAIENAARARHRAAEDISAATHGLADAQRDLAKANRELAQSVKDIADAMKVINQANAQVAFIVGQAFSGLGAFHAGGPIRRFHGGGPLERMHEGGPRPDERMIMAQVGEFMMRRQAVQSIGADNLAYANRTGRFPSDPALLDVLGRILSAVSSSGGRAPDLMVVPHEDPAVLARELSYRYGRGR